MWRRLCRLIASVLVWAALAVPAFAQPPQGQQPGEESGEVSATNALPYAFAILSTLLVMLIVCKPSRKS